MRSLIVALDKNNCIGRKGDIPWRIPEDLSYFKEKTEGKTVIMGKGTWDSLPYKPLKGRQNIVLTRRPHETGDLMISMFHVQGRNIGSEDSPAIELDNDILIVGSLQDAYHYAKYDTFVIGGSALYAMALSHVDRLYITEINLSVDDGDTYFPPLDPMLWREISRVPQNSSDIDFDFCVYERR